MHRLAWLVFALCLAAATTYIVITTGALPEKVASHFGPGNAPNAFMTRGGYLMFMLAFAVVLPIFIAAMKSAIMLPSHAQCAASALSVSSLRFGSSQ